MTVEQKEIALKPYMLEKDTYTTQRKKHEEEMNLVNMTKRSTYQIFLCRAYKNELPNFKIDGKV